MRYGGQVNTSVIVRLKPSVSTAVGTSCISESMKWREGAPTEIFETVGRNVHVLHENEDPQPRIFNSLLQPLKCAGFAIVANGVAVHSLLCKHPLVRSEPPCFRGVIWQSE